MKKQIILTVFFSFVLSGCATKQMVEKTNNDNIKLKKAVVKLIEKNKEVNNEIRKQNRKIGELNDQLDLLKKDIKKINKTARGIKNKEAVKKKIVQKKHTAQTPPLNIKQNNMERDFHIRVIKPMANLRSGPNGSSTIMGIAYINEIFQVLDRSKGEYVWYKIILKEKPVWIYSETVKIIEG